MSVRFKECSFPTFEEAKAAGKITVVPDDAEAFDVEGDLEAAAKAEDPDQFILELCVPAIDAFRGGWVASAESIAEANEEAEEDLVDSETPVDESVPDAEDDEDPASAE